MKIRLISVCLLICVLLGIIPMSAGAEDILETVTPSSKTLYVSNSCGDNTSGDGTSAKPYKTFEAAYKKMLATGGTIVIIDGPVKAFDTHTDEQKILDECQGTVYVCGIADKDGNYPTLDFSRTSSGATVVNLGTSMVFYDLTITNDGGNLWFAAAFHELTFGFNITMDMSDGYAVKLTGGYQSNKITANQDSDRGCNVNIYSGVFGDCYLGNFADMSAKGADYTVDKDSVFNLYGGEVQNIYGYRNADMGEKSFMADATINMYGGTVKEKIIVRGQLISANGYKPTLNLYNGAKPTDLGDTFKYNNRQYVNELFCRLSVPEYVVGYVGVQDGSADGDKYNVRFVGTVSSLGFDKVGFEIDASNGKEYDTSCKRVYTSILGDGKEYKAAELGGNYIFAVAIREIPRLHDDVSFKVIPFIEIGGLKYYAASQNVCYSKGEHAELEKAKAFTVASLNLLNNDNYASSDPIADGFDYSNYCITERMPRIINFINAEKPDSIGVQECEASLRETIDNGIKENGYLCAHDEVFDGTTYAFKNFIWYNSNTTELVESGRIWLSATPNTPSKAEGSHFYITAAWAKLRNEATGMTYVHVNTHLDTDSEELRNANVEVLMPLVQQFTDEDYDVFLTGDFNSKTGTDVYKTVTESLDDARVIADSATTVGTFKKFGYNNNLIDYCFCAVDNTVVNIDYLDVVEKFSDGKNAADYMSDHSAVVVGVSIYTKQQN